VRCHRVPSPRRAGGEGAEPHRRGFPDVERLIAEEHFCQVLRLARVDLGVRIEIEFTSHGAMNAGDVDIKGARHLLAPKLLSIP
jgi:hypothetical protein